MEDVWHDDKVAIRRELVRDELCIDECVADDIGEEKDAVCRGLVLGIGKVRIIWSVAILATAPLRPVASGVLRLHGALTLSDLAELASGLSFVLDANGAALLRRIGCHFEKPIEVAKPSLMV